MTKHYVYVLRSLADRQFYVGLTNDLPTRTQSHNLGLVPSTKRRGPFELVYWEGCLNRGDAAQREKSIQRAFHSQARPIQHMSVFHRRRYVPLPREIVSEAVLDITLAPGAFQIRLPLRGVLLAEASLPNRPVRRESEGGGVRRFRKNKRAREFLLPARSPSEQGC
jgi:putative endonuclease